MKRIWKEGYPSIPTPHNDFWGDQIYVGDEVCFIGLRRSLHSGRVVKFSPKQIQVECTTDQFGDNENPVYKVIVRYPNLIAIKPENVRNGEE